MINFRRARRGVPSLNTTSTADISFMLLIFFLVTTSMDMDKGLQRQLPAPEPAKTEMQESQVDKNTLLALRLTAQDTLLVNGMPMDVKNLRQEVVKHVNRLGARHLISIESDREAGYDLYFQMQNELMAAYHEIRDVYAKKKYGKSYESLAVAQKYEVRKACPQRISESYANAASMQTDKNMSVSKDDVVPASQKGGKP